MFSFVYIKRLILSLMNCFCYLVSYLIRLWFGKILEDFPRRLLTYFRLYFSRILGFPPKAKSFRCLLMYLILESRILPKKYFVSKIFNLVRIIVSIYKENLHIIFLPLKWLQQKCNVSHSKTLQPLSNLFEHQNTKFKSISHFFLMFFHKFIFFMQVFHYMVLIFHSLKGTSINFGYVLLYVLYIRF